MSLDDGITRQNITLDSPYYGIRLGPCCGIDNVEILQRLRHPGCGEHEGDDYIRNYKQFLEYAKK